jgi:multicomponent K+:H+ antiporter subunit E
MLRKLFPHPLLALILACVWLALVNKITLGNIILGGFLGLVIALMTAPYWPGKPRVRHPFKVVGYVFLVLWDIVVANVQIALIILFKPTDKLKSAWITVPLELTSPEAITVLAGTITMTPGTVSATLSSCGRAILVHALHTDDPIAVRDDIKSRYEKRLLEIFS